MLDFLQAVSDGLLFGATYALIGIGGGVLVGASVWLGIDEARAGQRRASAMVGWTMRF